ncbi:hypothetical protein EPO56_03265 [Patescibacteria group bacterium]|nr:MAG: hypothetical protein EPO56_03265 [Patescibacteria group bacterium]
MKITHALTQELLQEKAAEELSIELRKADGTSLLLLLSAGSALSFLSKVSIPTTTSHITVGVLDERHSATEQENNFFTLSKTEFYKTLIARGSQSIATNTRLESVEALALKMENSWKLWQEKNPQGLIIATLGMGSDGHTSGIMPYPEDAGMFEILFEDNRRYVVGYDARGKHPIPLRATVTVPFLKNNVNVAITYISGNEKQNAYERLIAVSGSLAETPARIFRKMQNVHLFTTITTHQ